MENNQLVQTMEYCRQNHLIASIYDDTCDFDQDGHWVGYIECVNEDEIVFKHISPRGEEDGFVWMMLDSVYRVDCGGKYERKIETLNERRKNDLSIAISNSDALLTSLFDASMKNEVILSVVTDDDDELCGIVKKYDDDTVVMQEIDEYGEEESVIVMESDRISTARYGGVEEQNRKYLWERRK